MAFRLRSSRKSSFVEGATEFSFEMLLRLLLGLSRSTPTFCRRGLVLSWEDLKVLRLVCSATYCGRTTRSK